MTRMISSLEFGAHGAPLPYDQLILASQQHDMVEEELDDYDLRQYEQDQAEFENYCHELWTWFHIQQRSSAPFC